MGDQHRRSYPRKPGVHRLSGKTSRPKSRPTRSSTALKTPLRNRRFLKTTTSRLLTGRHGSAYRSYASSANALTAMMKWVCFPACSFAGIAAASCISRGTRRRSGKQDCYICGSYKKRTADCTAHFIRTDYLTAGVIENLRRVTSYAARTKPGL